MRADLEDDSSDQARIDGARRLDLAAGRLLDLLEQVACLLVGELDRGRQLCVDDAFVLCDQALELARDVVEDAGAALVRQQEDEVAHELLEEHRKLIGQAKGEAEAILAEARKVADANERRMREETEADRQRRLEDTRKQIEAETRRALEQIREEVTALSLVAAEMVTRKSLDDADHRRLIEEAVGELDFSVLEAYE